ncbi:LysR family transcriptional regulator [Lacunisphaera limnophila]|nr:LysR family transcriptional regulator [Lacunisphaera limnophila]
MNVHHLELFYYVAKHGGISAAVRKIPYGIQQPAVSGQVGKLEKDLGVRLFERSPFRLTAAGERLFDHVQPFFEGLAPLAAELQEAAGPELRIGGAEMVLRDHLPGVMRRLRTRFPKLKLSLRTLGFQAEAETWLRNGHADVVFAPVYAKAPAGLKQTRFASVPLMLQVPLKSPLKSAAELWARKKITEPLICLPASTGITRDFFATLQKRGVTWRNVIEVTSLDLVTRYVANGDGIGLNVLVNPKAKSREVRLLPLAGFAPVTMGALWRGEPSPLVQAAIDSVRAYAQATWPDWVCGE